jgi:hypothetical protein
MHWICTVHSEDNGGHSAAAGDSAGGGGERGAARVSAAGRRALDRGVSAADHRRLAAAAADHLPHRLGHAQLLRTRQVDTDLRTQELLAGSMASVRLLFYLFPNCV